MDIFYRVMEMAAYASQIAYTLSVLRGMTERKKTEGATAQ